MDTVLPAPAQRDPSKVLVPCEVPTCGRGVEIGHSFSFIVAYATTGPANDVSGQHLAAFQCPAEQHFGCCPEHAAIAAKACIDEHLQPMHTEKHAQMAQAHIQHQKKHAPRKKGTT